MLKVPFIALGILALTAPLSALANTAHDPIGVLESVTADGQAIGWAYDPDSQSQATRIDLYIDAPYAKGGVFVGSVMTTVSRPDVNTHLGVTGAHGFSFTVPAMYFDGMPHTLYAYVLNVPGTFGATMPLIGSPRTFSIRPHDPQGALDGISGNVSVTGWAIDFDSPTSSIGIDFYIDQPAINGGGNYVGSTIANLPRPDVNAYLGTTGNHGYSFSVPTAYVDGKSHTVYAYAINAHSTAGSNVLLPGSPKIFTLAAAPRLGNARIEANGVMLQTQARYGGAIASLQWNGKEFIDSRDHGRLLQIAWTGDRYGECFNPTEGGSREDDTSPYTSSELLSLTTTENSLSTVSHPAFWQAPGTRGVACGFSATSTQVWREGDTVNTTFATKALLSKTVTIGSATTPTALHLAFDIALSPEELTQVPLSYLQVAAPALFMPSEFSHGYRFNPKNARVLDYGTFLQPFVITSIPLVLSTEDKQYAIGIYSPNVPPGGFPQSEQSAYSGYTIQNWGGGMMIGASIPMDILGSSIHLDTYVVVGTYTQVLAQLSVLYSTHPPVTLVK